MTTINYSVVSDSKDWEKKANSLNTRGVKWGEEFNHFVKASISFFYGEGNKNVEILNGLINIAYNAKGVNAGALIDYIGKIVPHMVRKDKENTKRFVFTGKKKDKEYPDAVTVEVFLFEHAHWTSCINPSTTPKEFNPELAVVHLLSKAEKNGKLEETLAAIKAKIAEVKAA